MSPELVTPVLLTFNEERNIGRTLRSLRGFERVVVLDSGSTDRTKTIACEQQNVRWFMNPFESHVAQWRWAIEKTGIDTPFVLALDADMSLTPELIREVRSAVEGGDCDAALIPVEYRIRGVRLVGSLYPQELRLFRRDTVSVVGTGHTQKFVSTGRVARLRHRLVHDDRKPLEAFVRSQLGYSEMESKRLLAAGTNDVRLRSRLRRSFAWTPLLVWMLAWIRAGGPFRGAAARRYALERLIYEAMLRWRLEDAALSASEERDGEGHDRSDGP